MLFSLCHGVPEFKEEGGIVCGFIDTFEHIWDHLNLCPSAMSNQLLSFFPGLYLPQVKDMGILLDSCLIILRWLSLMEKKHHSPHFGGCLELSYHNDKHLI